MALTLGRAAAVWKAASNSDDLATESGLAMSAQTSFALSPTKGLTRSPKSTPGSDSMSRKFWRTHNILHEMFKANDNFEVELGSNPYTFVDIGCAPGGFSRFLLDHTQCIGGTGVSLPVEQGGLKMLLKDSRMKTIMQDLMQALPYKCFGPNLVDFCVADASSDWNLASAGRKRIKNPLLIYWAVLMQELWLGLSVLGHGGVFIFQFMGKRACTEEWHIDACTCLLKFMDGLFEATKPFQFDSKSFYIICRGFRHDAFLATSAAEALHQSVLEVCEHGPVHGLLNLKLFKEMRAMDLLPPRAVWIQSAFGKTIRRGNLADEVSLSRQVREEQRRTVQKGFVKKTGLPQCPKAQIQVTEKNTFLEEVIWVRVLPLRRVSSVPAGVKLAAFTCTSDMGAKRASVEVETFSNLHASDAGGVVQAVPALPPDTTASLGSSLSVESSAFVPNRSVDGMARNQGASELESGDLTVHTETRASQLSVDAPGFQPGNWWILGQRRQTQAIAPHAC